MANLKLDLLSDLGKDKMFAELELVRLAQEPNMNYKEKIELMHIELEELALLDTKIALVNQYFQEQPQQAAPAPAPEAPAEAPAAPQGKVHQGQSHGEA